MKRASGQESSAPAQQESAAVSITAAAEHKIEEFAEDLGRLLGTARAKAEGWMGQRQTVARHLEEIRDTAAELLAKLGAGGAGSARPAAANQFSSASDAGDDAAVPGKKKRTMSAAARKAISDAQKARWAKQRRNKGAM